MFLRPLGVPRRALSLGYRGRSGLSPASGHSVDPSRAWVEEPALDDWMDLDVGADASFEILSLEDEGGRRGDPDQDLPDSPGSSEPSESTTEAMDWVGFPPKMSLTCTV